MPAEKVEFKSVQEACEAIEGLGSSNSELMATRAVHVNIVMRDVPGGRARTLKRIYNDIGAEVAVSHDAFYEKEGVSTDMIVMGTIYQHREARRILADDDEMTAILNEIYEIVEAEAGDFQMQQ